MTAFFNKKYYIFFIFLIGGFFSVAFFADAAAGLTANCYDGMSFTTLWSTVTDTTVNFNPADTTLGINRANGGDTFSCRWTGYVRADFTQSYTFYTMSDDGVRLWVNSVQLVNNWTDHGPTENSGTIALTAGQWYPVTLEFYENGGGAVIQLSYSSASVPKQIIPSTNLSTTPPVADASVFVSQISPPVTMTTGQTANVSVTMQNTGSATWTPGTNYRLGSQNPQDNSTWGFNRVNLPVASVAPGASVTFNFTVTAPSTPGTHNYQWRMVHDGVTWFGGLTPNISVTVSASAATPCAVPFPSGSFCGDYYTSASAGAFTTFKNKVTSEGNATTPFLNYNPFDATLGQAARCGQQDLCAVRWQGNFSFNAVSYTFSVTTDDGIRFYIDGVLRIDQWFDQCCPTYTYTQNMTAGTHLIKVEYYENAGGAEAVVGWTQNAAPDTTPPTQPTGLTATAISTSQINLAWNASTDPESAITNYKIYRCSGTGCTPTLFTTLGNVTTYSNTSLTASTLYRYQVSAVNSAALESALSACCASATTLSPPPPPNVLGYAWAGNGQNDGSSNNPGIGWIHMSGTAGSDTYGVSVSSASPGVLSGYAWANPNDSVAGTNNIGWISFNATDVAGCPTAPCTPTLDRTTGQISGWARAIVNGGGWDGWIHLRNGVLYGVSVSGCNWSGYAWGGGTVLGWIHFLGTNYGATGSGDGCASSDSVTVNATLNGVPWSGPGTIRYSIAGPTSVPAGDYTVPQVHSGMNAGSYTITYISGGPAGGVVSSITPVNPQTLISGSPITFTLNFGTVPPVPAGLAVDVTSLNVCGGIRLTWNNVAGEDTYNLERDDGGWHSIATPVADDTDFTDTTIAQNIPYSYRISACNAFGCSVPSSSVSATNRSPSANFTWVPAEPQVNQLATFTDASTAYGGATLDTWQWTFEDGNPASAATQNATTRFVDADPTSKNASLQVTDSAARTCSISQVVPIRTGSGVPIWIEEPPE